MKNPFVQKMPLGTDIKIRLRIMREFISKWPTALVASFMIPALAVYLLVISTGEEINVEQLVVDIRTAQIEERDRAEGAIYHVTREITEGSQKPNFVREVLAYTEEVEVRTDVVDTYQHSDTALTKIESNGTERSFEVFLSREHDELTLALHHYGPVDSRLKAERGSYDEAHDLASLYTSYTSLERPDVPLLADESIFVELTDDNRLAKFEIVLNESIRVESYVDVETMMVVEEVIYVATDSGAEYEMTRVAYTLREVLPTSEFDEVFDPEEFNYEVIATKEISLG